VYHLRIDRNCWRLWL